MGMDKEEKLTPNQIRLRAESDAARKKLDEGGADTGAQQKTKEEKDLDSVIAEERNRGGIKTGEKPDLDRYDKFTKYNG